MITKEVPITRKERKKKDKHNETVMITIQYLSYQLKQQH